MTGLQVNPSFSYLKNTINRPKTEIKRKRSANQSRIVNTRNTIRDHQDNLPLLGLSGIHVSKHSSLPHKKEIDIPMLDKRYSIQKEIMNEKNLRIHNDEIRRASLVSNLERIAQWAKSIPYFEPLDIYAMDKVDLLETNSMPSNRLPSPMSQNVTKMIQRATSCKEKSILPCLGTAEPEQDQIRILHSKRGKLLCCLKVEIKTGIFKMLPVHANDDPFLLSTSFCKAYNLQSSITNLKEHICKSKKAFS
jgi:hypothetical protein